MRAIECQVCGDIATHHHSGNHFCGEHAKVYAQSSKWKRVLFWYTPKGAVKTELGKRHEYLEAL